MQLLILLGPICAIAGPLTRMGDKCQVHWSLMGLPYYQLLRVSEWRANKRGGIRNTYYPLRMVRPDILFQFVVGYTLL